ncbi:MAG: hypothetical protein ACHQ52_12860 [Candidatus Eisenbacteria bacterium]
MKRCLRYVLPPILLLIVVSCAPKGEKAGQASNPPSTQPRVAERMLKRWMIGLTNRHPGSGATHPTDFGSGALGVTVSKDATMWYETADVDSNGKQELIGFMWDAPSKVMYAYTHDPVTLSDGTVADKGLLVAQFGDGNTKGKPVGSGWYAYTVERDSTAGKVGGKMFGCTFDAAGNEVECGEGTFDRSGNELKIAVKPQ